MVKESHACFVNRTSEHNKIFTAHLLVRRCKQNYIWQTLISVVLSKAWVTMERWFTDAAVWTCLWLWFAPV